MANDTIKLISNVGTITSGVAPTTENLLPGQAAFGKINEDGKYHFFGNTGEGGDQGKVVDIIVDTIDSTVHPDTLEQVLTAGKTTTLDIIFDASTGHTTVVGHEGVSISDGSETVSMKAGEGFKDNGASVLSANPNNTIDAAEQTQMRAAIDVFSKSEVQALVSSVYRTKGTIQSFETLIESTMHGYTPEIGDVWNVKTAGGKDINDVDIKAGDNIAYVGPNATTDWDVLSGVVDLSDYYNKTDVDGIKTGLQNSIDSVQTATDNVKTIAESALDTANTASSAADVAVHTANTSNTTANQAVTTAQNAVKTAEDAVDVADSAVNTANNAVDTANNAVATANGAETTANAAKTTADSAASTANQANETSNDAKSVADTANGVAASAKTSADNAVATANGASSSASAAIKTANTISGIIDDMKDIQMDGTYNIVSDESRDGFGYSMIPNNLKVEHLELGTNAINLTSEYFDHHTFVATSAGNISFNIPDYLADLGMTGERSVYIPMGALIDYNYDYHVDGSRTLTIYIYGLNSSSSSSSSSSYGSDIYDIYIYSKKIAFDGIRSYKLLQNIQRVDIINEIFKNLISAANDSSTSRNMAIVTQGVNFNQIDSGKLDTSYPIVGLKNIKEFGPINYVKGGTANGTYTTINTSGLYVVDFVSGYYVKIKNKANLTATVNVPADSILCFNANITDKLQYSILDSTFSSNYNKLVDNLYALTKMLEPIILGDNSAKEGKLISFTGESDENGFPVLKVIDKSELQ